MKTATKLTLTALAAVLFATGGRAFANDSELRVIDNHHGVFTYVNRPAQTQTKTPTTIAVYTHGKAIGHADTGVKRDDLTFRQVSTPHGTVSYFAPAE